MIRLCFLISLFLPAAAISESAKIGSKGMIEIRSYDPTHNLFDLKYLRYPGQGPFYATPENLAKGIHALDLKLLKRAPTSIVGNQYKVDQDIPLADEPGIKKLPMKKPPKTKR